MELATNISLCIFLISASFTMLAIPAFMIYEMKTYG